MREWGAFGQARVDAVRVHLYIQSAYGDSAREYASENIVSETSVRTILVQILSIPFLGYPGERRRPVAANTEDHALQNVAPVAAGG